MEGVEAPSLFMINPSLAATAQRLGVGEALHLPGQSDLSMYGYKDMRAEHGEVVRRLSLNQAALLDHYEAMAYGGYPMTAHQLGHLSFHQQRQAAAASLGFDPVPAHQPAFMHPHIMQRMSAHSPIPSPIPPMSAPPGGAIPPSSDACYPPSQQASSSAFSMSAPPVMTDAPPSTGSVFEFHLAAAAAAAAGDPSLLASRLFRSRRSSMDLPLEDNTGTGSGGSGTYSRLQPVTEELSTYVSPELPLPPGSLLLHHAGLNIKDRSPDPSSDSMASSDAGEFQSPPPPPPLLHSFDSSAAQSIPQSSSGGFHLDPQGHPPSMQSFLPPTPSSEHPHGGASSTQLETLMQSAWARHGAVIPAQPDMTYHESLLAMQATNPILQVQAPSPQPSTGPPLVPAAAVQPAPIGTPQQVISSNQSVTSVQSPTHTPLPQASAQSPVQPSELSQSQLQPPQVLSSIESCHSEMSGLSDGNEGGGGRHEGRSAKRHQRRSVRSRSRHEKLSKAKLNVLNISNRGDRVAECQLETHNRKMVTFRFDLDGDNPEEIAQIMVQSEFILESERESFIEQVREVIENADEKGLERDASSQMAGDQEQKIPTISIPMPDIHPSATSQVVHSAGRRFIVSPVPEARLKELVFPTSPPAPAAAAPPDTVPPAAAPVLSPEQTLGLSQSAGAVTLQQAFSKLKQNHFDAGPSTAPASIQSTHPPLQPAAASVPPQANTLAPAVEVLAGRVPPNLNQAKEQLSDSSLPSSPSIVTPTSVPVARLNTPCSSPPPPPAVVLQPQVPPQAASQPKGQVQGQAQIQPEAFPQPQMGSAVITTSAPSPLPPGGVHTTAPPVSSPPSSIHTASEVSSNHLSVSPTSSSPNVSSTAIPGPQLAPSAAPHLTPPPASSSFSPVGLQPVTTNVPSVQPTLVHSQPQTAAMPGQPHAHCGESDARCEATAESQGKPDDIQALEKKLRSLFMDLGGGVPPAQGDIVIAEPAPGASVACTSSPVVPCSTSSTSVPTPCSIQPANTPQPPSSLALGSPAPIQCAETPISTPGQMGSTVIPASSFGQTTPSKTPLSRVPVSSPCAELLSSFPGPCLIQSQQPLEDLDAQLRRALSPEPVPVTVNTQASHSGLPPGGPIPLSLDEESASFHGPGIKLGRFQVSLAAEEPLVKKAPSIKSSSTTSSSSTSSSSSSLSSPENTLHKDVLSPFRAQAVGKAGDVVDGLPQRTLGGSHHPSPFTSPCPSPKPTTTIGRFQVTTNSEARVGRFSVSRAVEQNVESVQTPPPATPAANGQTDRDEVLSPDPSHKASLPSLNNNSFNNSYISSDNDSEFEDEDFKREIGRLREKHMREIQALHSRQKEEIDRLFTKLGKAPPATALPPVITLTGRRRRPTKSKSSKSSRTSSSHGSKSPLQQGSTLSAQSVPTMYPPQLALLAPGGLANSCSSTQLQPLKPSPSSNNLCSTYTSEGALSVPSLCAPTPGTNSTNAVSGSSGLGQSQGGSQSLPSNMSAPHQRKGTFTDDLHKLVDNWARDAMNLSQGKRSAKQLQQNSAQGLSYEVVQSASLGRKYSAPSQLCSSSIGSSAHLPTNPPTVATSLAARKASLCHAPCTTPPPQSQAPQFINYTPTAAYSAQWSGPAHGLSTPQKAPAALPGPPLLVSTSQPLGPYPATCQGHPSQGPLPAFHPANALQKSVSNPGGPNLRTT